MDCISCGGAAGVSSLGVVSSPVVASCSVAGLVMALVSASSALVTDSWLLGSSSFLAAASFAVAVGVESWAESAG